jgi:peptidoglycan/xylan/chitin deacetylase (PgdA/CDA1 family)
MRRSSKTTLIVCAAAVLVAAVCIFVWLQLQKKRVLPVPILVYHNLGQYDQEGWIAPASFKAHIGYLHENGYKSVLPSDLAANRAWGKPLPRKPVIITLDDGYLNALIDGEPVLRKHGFRGIIYVDPSLIGDSIGTRREHNGSICLIWPEISSMLERRTITFGLQGGSTNVAQLTGELEQHLAAFEQHTGFRPTSFLFPDGKGDGQFVPALQQTGFRTAVTDSDATAFSGPDAELFSLPRLHVSPEREDLIRRLRSAALY